MNSVMVLGYRIEMKIFQSRFRKLYGLYSKSITFLQTRCLEFLYLAQLYGGREVIVGGEGSGDVTTVAREEYNSNDYVNDEPDQK